MQINIAPRKIYSATHGIDILIALTTDTIELHLEEINKGGFVLCDTDTPVQTGIKRALDKKKVALIKLPIQAILKKHNAPIVMGNSIFTGACWALITRELSPLLAEVKEVFKSKAKDVLTNEKCTKDGYDYAAKNYQSLGLKQKKSQNRIIGTGNEVAGLSLFASGCKLYCSYPMTPATGILHYLAPRAQKQNIIVKQAEDELTAVLTCIGANFAGTRAACATSGGGLALMTESFSLAGITETPLMVINSQRPGPATGLPTWTEQGDLGFVSKIGHGEFPRIILAPGDIDEVFKLIPKAFNLAEKYQTLVVVLLDKYLSESWYQTEEFSDSSVSVHRGQITAQSDLNSNSQFKRYKISVSGVSPRSLPGMKNGIFLSNSDEHDEIGYSTEDLLTRKQMMDKRMRKAAGIYNEIPGPRLYGPERAKTTIVCWGSQKGPVLDAIAELNEKKVRVNMLHFSYVFPIKDTLLRKLAKRNKLIAVENNYSGQLASLIREQTGIYIESRINKYVGTPFFKDELVEILKRKG
jgi:2-oxoglutarate ferredoxin oxidoreductase subunit alpha